MDQNQNKSNTAEIKKNNKKNIILICVTTIILFLVIGGAFILNGNKNKTKTVAVIKTNHGDMTVEFYEKEAPKAVENFVTLSKQGYYNGLIFHRVIKDFVIQGGDPNGNGTGGESIWGGTFENEISKKRLHDYGALAMAHSMQPDSNGSQFYIVQNKNGLKDLDGDYTVFGHLIDGYETLEDIASQETDNNDRPLENVVIETIEVKEIEDKK